jgi:hypothetical protein
LKGFDGEVHYVGSDATYAYFLVGVIFRSYYKVPICAAHVPETFSVGDGKPYVVKLHVKSDNTIQPVNRCSKVDGYTLGDLDRK